MFSSDGVSMSGSVFLAIVFVIAHSFVEDRTGANGSHDRPQFGVLFRRLDRVHSHHPNIRIACLRMDMQRCEGLVERCRLTGLLIFRRMHPPSA